MVSSEPIFSALNDQQLRLLFDAQRSMKRYGRLPDEVHARDQMVSCPWPGPYSKTFPAKDKPNNWCQVKDDARRMGAELTLRGRRDQYTLTIFFDDECVRRTVLTLVVESSEACGTDMSQAGAE
jgi:hypothetical protein